MAEVISHKGTVIYSDADVVRVGIVSESACASCHASGLCGMAGSKKKTVEVPSRGMSYQVGDEVEVCLAQKTGLKAVLFSYVVPVLILLILILSLPKIGLGELVCGVVSLGGIALYYLVLYLCRDHLAEGYEFYIRR